jgi:hypothetical protein
MWRCEPAPLGSRERSLSLSRLAQIGKDKSTVNGASSRSRHPVRTAPLCTTSTSQSHIQSAAGRAILTAHTQTSFRGCHNPFSTLYLSFSGVSLGQNLAKMRLLQVDEHGELSLTDNLLGGDIPSYGILSHTRGSDENEVTFRELTKGPRRKKIGYKKLWFYVEQAARDGLCYVSVDSCCTI